jgi:hypothetical protein
MAAGPEEDRRSLVPGRALHTFGAPVDFRGRGFEPFRTQPVLSYRLDDLIEVFDLPLPTHIKVDVDGLEAAVIEGASRTVRNARLRSVLVELIEGTEAERRVRAQLEREGFRVEAIERYRLSADEGDTVEGYNCLLKRAPS